MRERATLRTRIATSRPSSWSLHRSLPYVAWWRSPTAHRLTNHSFIHSFIQPQVHRELTKMIVDMLHRITTNSAINKMSTQVHLSLHRLLPRSSLAPCPGWPLLAHIVPSFGALESRHLPVSQRVVGTECRLLVRGYAQDLQHRHELGRTEGLHLHRTYLVPACLPACLPCILTLD